MTPTPAMPVSANRSQYFPYIDGMRALAVLSVLIFHLNGPWLPGGFVGVDIFFVISGFVVSASLGNYKGAGFWRFLGYFYARRIKRIFPALIVCLLGTFLVSALFIPTIWLSSVNQQTGLFAFLGLSNFILASTGRDYFGPTTEFNPFTHTWSLAVEEQFYLVFPLLFIGWLIGGRGKRLSVVLFGVAFLASLAFAWWQSAANPTQAYFLTPSRFWEMASGVLLFQCMKSSKKSVSWQGLSRGVLAGISLFLVIVAFFSTSPERFPMPGALLAVLGTLGLLGCLYEQPQLRRMHTLLGYGPLVAVGRISYSLYLWHWPVFVLFRWTIGLETFTARVLAVGLAFGLAVASYRLVENPVRRSRILARLPQAGIVAGGLLVIGAAWWGAQALANNQQTISLASASRDPVTWHPHGASTSPKYPGCIVAPEFREVAGATLMTLYPKGCLQPRPPADATLYVIGDSHAQAYEALFREYSMEKSMRVQAYVKSGCAFVSLQPWNDDAACRAFATSVLNELQDLKAGDVLFLPSLRLPRLSDQWANFGLEQARLGMFGPEADAGRSKVVAQTVATLRAFTERGIHVVFEAPKPLFNAPPFRCADWFNRSNPICANGLDIPRQAIEELRQPVIDAFSDIARQLPGVSTWDPLPTLCPGEQCSAWDQGKPLFLDGDHLSGYGNRKLVPAFSAYMDGLFNQPVLAKLKDQTHGKRE